MSQKSATLAFTALNHPEAKSFNRQRFLQLAIGIPVASCVGIAYCFSIISNKLKVSEGLSQEDVTSISTAGAVAGYMNLPFGILYDTFGPKPVLFICGLLCCVGFILLSLVFSAHIAFSVPLMCAINALINLGVGSMDTGSLMSNLYAFPMSRGEIIIIQKTFMGLGATLFSLMFEGFFESITVDPATGETVDESNYVGYARFMAAFVAISLIFATALTELPDYHQTSFKKWRHQRTKRRRMLLSANALSVAGGDASSEAAEGAAAAAGAEYDTEWREEISKSFARCHEPLLVDRRRLALGLTCLWTVLIFFTIISFVNSYVEMSVGTRIALGVVALALFLSFFGMAWPWRMPALLDYPCLPSLSFDLERFKRTKGYGTNGSQRASARTVSTNAADDVDGGGAEYVGPVGDDTLDRDHYTTGGSHYRTGHGYYASVAASYAPSHATGGGGAGGGGGLYAGAHSGGLSAFADYPSTHSMPNVGSYNSAQNGLGAGGGGAAGGGGGGGVRYGGAYSGNLSRNNTNSQFNASSTMGGASGRHTHSSSLLGGGAVGGGAFEGDSGRVIGDDAFMGMGAGAGGRQSTQQFYGATTNNSRRILSPNSRQVLINSNSAYDVDATGRPNGTVISGGGGGAPSSTDVSSDRFAGTDGGEEAPTTGRTALPLNSTAASTTTNVYNRSASHGAASESTVSHPTANTLLRQTLQPNECGDDEEGMGTHVPNPADYLPRGGAGGADDDGILRSVPANDSLNGDALDLQMTIDSLTPSGRGLGNQTPSGGGGSGGNVLVSEVAYARRVSASTAPVMPDDNSGGINSSPSSIVVVVDALPQLQQPKTSEKKQSPTSPTPPPRDEAAASSSNNKDLLSPHSSRMNRGASSEGAAASPDGSGSAFDEGGIGGTKSTVNLSSYSMIEPPTPNSSSGGNFIKLYDEEISRRDELRRMTDQHNERLGLMGGAAAPQISSQLTASNVRAASRLAAASSGKLSAASNKNGAGYGSSARNRDSGGGYYSDDGANSDGHHHHNYNDNDVRQGLLSAEGSFNNNANGNGNNKGSKTRPRDSGVGFEVNENTSSLRAIARAARGSVIGKTFEGDMGAVAINVLTNPAALHSSFLSNLVRSPFLWCFWWINFAVWGTGAIFVNNMSQIYRSVNDNVYNGSTNSLYVAVMGIGSALGRVFIGYVEMYIRKRKAEREAMRTIKLRETGFAPDSEPLVEHEAFSSITILLPMAPIIMTVTALVMTIAPPQALGIVFGANAFGFGSSWAIFILSVREIFAVDIGKNYNFCFTSGILAAFVLNREMFGKWYDAEANRQRNQYTTTMAPTTTTALFASSYDALGVVVNAAPPSSDECSGNICIRDSMIVLGALSFSAFLVALFTSWWWLRRKRAYIVAA